jgi:ATP-dependent Clp protease ATP-binding subunit ClpA
MAPADPDGQQVMRLAFAEARELDMPCIGDEHVLLGLLRHSNSRAAAMLQAHGLDLAAAHAGLRRLDPAPGAGASPAAALRSLGIDTEECFVGTRADHKP